MARLFWRMAAVALALLDDHGERPLHLGEAVRVAEEGAGIAANAERSGRLRQAERSASAQARSAAAIASPWAPARKCATASSA